MRNLKPLLLANSLRGFEIHAEDGKRGRIDDFYFNDQTWKILHVGVSIGAWLSGHKVVLEPNLLGHVDWHKKFIEAWTTMQQITLSPDSDTVLPVALQIQKQIDFSIMQDATIPETYLGMHRYIEPFKPLDDSETDSHLQSTRVLKDCAIISEDHRGFGKALDFLIDTEIWEIRFLLLKTNDGRIFLAESEVVKSIEISNRTITVINPDDEKREWQEYDPHYMALLEIAQR